MRSFRQYNPFVILLYFIAVTLTDMFSAHPIIIVLSLLGAISLYLTTKGASPLFSDFYLAGLFLILAVINPLVVHNGVTVLFIFNDNPVTWEATLYGAVTAGAIVSVLYWFRSFSRIMTSDKLLYVLGSLSPRLALLLSMTLRYIPLFGRQAIEVQKAQKGMGLYKEDSIWDNIRGKTRIFSIMTTWALENGILTADSMAARGYGTGKRSHFSLFHFTPIDFLFLAVTLLLAAGTWLGLLTGALKFVYYPAVAFTENNGLCTVSLICYGLLCFLPTLNELSEALQWKFLRLKI